MGGYVAGTDDDFGIAVSLATDNPLVADTWADAVNDILDRKDTELGYMGILAGLVGTYGLIRQYELMERQVDLNERVVDYTERNYDEIALPAYEHNEDLFVRYETDFAPYELEYINEAKSKLEYTPDYEGQAGRAMAGVGEQFTRLRQRRTRQRRKYATGECCSENLLLDVMQAQALAQASNRGYRYEDERKLRLEEWYWSRYASGAQLVETMRANVISGVNSGVANASGAVGQITAAARGATDAINTRASFFGTLSNGAFQLAGFDWGRNSIRTGYGPFTGGGYNPLAMLGNSAMTSLSTTGAGGLSSGFSSINARLGSFFGNGLGMGLNN
ncbi:MAG: hypothetical protein ACK5MY_02535 [Jhaorihella sp.]